MGFGKLLPICSNKRKYYCLIFLGFMIIFVVEVTLILLLFLTYLRRELQISIRYFRHGDVIWVRHKSIKPQRAVLSKWNNTTFCYMLDDSIELHFKKWHYLARNESYTAREKQDNVLSNNLVLSFPRPQPVPTRRK